MAKGLVGLVERPKQNRTIGELMDALEADFKMRGKCDARNQSNFRGARAVFPAAMKAASLTSEMVDKYIEKRIREGLAPATVNRMVGLVAQAYKKAIERGDIDRAPKFRHLSEKGNERKGFFEADEFRRVHSHLPDDLRDFCLFAYLTAWRKNEIASLTWRDVEGDVVRLRGENAKNGLARSVVIAGELVDVMARRKEARLANGTLTALVFHRDGLPVQEFRKAWQP